METAMETENQASEKSSSEKWQSCTPIERSEAIVLKLARFYGVMGHRPDEPGALALMAEILTQSASDGQIDSALTRCAHECRYPVRLSDILQRIPGLEVPQAEAEGRKAWDVLMGFVNKYVGNSVYGVFGPDHGWHPTNYPKLSDRISDTVRRTGGWSLYKCMTDADFPFVQKRFFEEYAAWVSVEQVVPGKLLTERPRLRLVPKPIEIPKPEIQPKPAGEQALVMKIPEPLTEAQIRDRREMLRQQAEFFSKRPR
jgi:hypothetical protein